MKKFKLILLIPLFILLISCSASPKNTFKERMGEVTNKDQVAQRFTLAIKKIKIGDEDVTSLFDFGASKKKKINVEIHQSRKDEEMSVVADFTALGEDWYHFDIIHNEGKSYMNMEALVYYLGQNGSFYTLKYLDLNDYLELEEPLFNPGEKADLAWIDAVDDKNFTEKDGTVTGTFPLNTFLDSVNETIKGKDAELENAWKSAIDSYSKKSTVTITYDEDGNGRILINLINDSGSENDISEIELEVKFKEIDYLAPEMPKDYDIISKSGMEIIMTARSKMDDQTFENTYRELSKMDKKGIEAALEVHSDRFTDEQREKVEELLREKSE